MEKSKPETKTPERDELRPDDDLAELPIDGAGSEPDPAEEASAATPLVGDAAKAAIDAEVVEEYKAREPEPLFVGLPQFQSTRTVGAFKINELVALSNGEVRLIGDDCMAVVGSAWVDAHRPQAGLYYVKDRFRTFLIPARDFEADFEAA